VPIVWKSGGLNLLEPSGPVQARTGISLLFCTSGIVLKKLLVAQLLNITPDFYGIRISIVAFTAAHYWALEESS
jgi:hypothetical protein